MSKSHVFPYGIALREADVVDIFPVAEVAFPYRGGDWISLFLIIDSGAAVSALPKNDASMLGIDFKKGIPLSIAGIGGESIRGWKHEITARLGEERIAFPVVFLDNKHSPRVLGRAGLFERYAIIFEEMRRRSSFIGGATKESRSVRNILDRISKET